MNPRRLMMSLHAKGRKRRLRKQLSASMDGIIVVTFAHVLRLNGTSCHQDELERALVLSLQLEEAAKILHGIRHLT